MEFTYSTNEKKPVGFTFCDTPPLPHYSFLTSENRQTEEENEAVVTGAVGSLSRTAADAGRYASVVEALGLNPSHTPCSLGPGLCVLKLQ